MNLNVKLYVYSFAMEFLLMRIVKYPLITCIYLIIITANNRYHFLNNPHPLTQSPFIQIE